MFHLHDRTRHRICLVGFCLFCLVPTVAVIAWSVARNSETYVALEKQRLRQYLGLDVALEDLTHVCPGVVRYEGLSLADPETGWPLFHCDSLEIEQTEVAGPQESARPALKITATGPELEGASLKRAWGLLERIMQRRTGQPEIDLRVASGDVLVRAEGRSRTLSGVEGSVETLPGGCRLRFSFFIDGVDMPQPAVVWIVRDRQSTPPAMGFEIHTGGGELPCELLSMGLPPLQALGPKARFRGVVRARIADGTPAADFHGDFRGELIDVDFGHLISDHFPHQLSGIGRVTIPDPAMREHGQPALFEHGRLTKATGLVAIGSGNISRPLLDAAADRLAMARGPDPLPPTDLVPFDQVAFAFGIDSQGGLQCQGRCVSVETGTVVARGRQTLLSQPTARRLPVVALLQTLVPDATLQAPATTQTNWLMRHLPLPQPAPVATVERRSVYGNGRSIERR